MVQHGPHRLHKLATHILHAEPPAAPAPAAPSPAAAAGSEAAKRPLAGTKLIDMTTVIAGPYTAGQLADYGMDVIKVENADGLGDTYRYGGSSVRLEASGEGYGASYAQFNRGKKSIAVNAADERGRNVVLELVKGADVFLQNMRPVRSDGHCCCHSRRPRSDAPLQHPAGCWVPAASAVHSAAVSG